MLQICRKLQVLSADFIWSCAFLLIHHNGCQGDFLSVHTLTTTFTPEILVPLLSFAGGQSFLFA